MFERALVRPPASNFASGLTTVDLGTPAFEKALAQYERYCEALIQCGLALTRLPADPGHPDSTFVEDTAVLTKAGAILTRPGAPSRAGEVAGIEAALRPFFSSFARIADPGTDDGGDICEAGDHYFIGISARTNPEGARQLARFLAEAGATSAEVDIRGVEGILHLKSGIAALSERHLAVIDALAGHEAFRGYQILGVPAAESYAANCVRVNDAVLVADGFPSVEGAIRSLGHRVVPLDMSEFQKMDGGLSCLSLRF
jgi:dimethylargininase